MRGLRVSLAWRARTAKSADQPKLASSSSSSTLKNDHGRSEIRNLTMATQDESGIEFSIVSEESQQHFRLLELPKELLSLLTSENAPMYVARGA